MKKFIKVVLVLVLLAGWVLAASSLYLVRAPGRFAGIPKTEWAGRFALITKDCMGWRDTFADTSKWTPSDLAAHPAVVQRIKESGHKELISHITEMGLADAGKTDVAPQPVVAPADSKADTTIFDFPDKK